MSFARNRVPGGPAGADRDEIAPLFAPHWQLAVATPDSDAAPKGPMRDIPRFCYRLTRAT